MCLHQDFMRVTFFWAVFQLAWQISLLCRKVQFVVKSRQAALSGCNPTGRSKMALLTQGWSCKYPLKRYMKWTRVVNLSKNIWHFKLTLWRNQYAQQGKNKQASYKKAVQNNYCSVKFTYWMWNSFMYSRGS